MHDPFLQAAFDFERLACERSLAMFLRTGWRNIDGAAYIHGWHLDAIAEHLEAVTRGDIRRLVINIPPRHAKSLAVSVAWPAWTWAQETTGPLSGPQVKFLSASYAHDLAIRDSRKMRQLVESPWYRERWGQRFTISDDQSAKRRFDNDKMGARLATSVGGALTGEGGDVILIDDPLSATDSESEVARATMLEWWSGAMSSRLNDPATGAFVIVMQRLHEGDLTGEILAKERGWTHLCLPARYEPDHPHVYARDRRTTPGALLWPERFKEPEVAALERTMGSYRAAGQLQQRPAPRDGGMFQRRWFDIVQAAPVEAERCRKWDLAATVAAPGRDPDWTVGLRMSRDKAGFFYIEDVQRMRATAHEVERAILTTAALDGPNVQVGLNQDPGQAGKAQAAYLVRALAGYVVKAAPETGSKEMRATPFSAQAEAGNVRLVKAPWNEAFLAELETFPRGRHDDQVDAAAGAFAILAIAPPIASQGLLDLYAREAKEMGLSSPEERPVTYAPGSVEFMQALGTA